METKKGQITNKFYFKNFIYQICNMERITENSIKNGISEMLSTAVFNAELLLNYATEHGLDIEKEWVGVLINAKRCEESREWDADTEINFWMAYKGLSKIVRPVSVQSLKATKRVEIKTPNYLRNFNG